MTGIKNNVQEEKPFNPAGVAREWLGAMSDDEKETMKKGVMNAAERLYNAREQSSTDRAHG